jgi:hypothetical protein
MDLAKVFTCRCSASSGDQTAQSKLSGHNNWPWSKQNWDEKPYNTHLSRD